MKKKIAFILSLCLIVSGVFAVSYNYAESLDTLENIVAETEEIDRNEEVEIKENIKVPDIMIQAVKLPTFSLNVNTLNVAAAKNDTGKKTETEKKTVSYKNSYGKFTFTASDGKITKYKYEDYSTKKRYLIKGTVKFAEQDVTFDGYFLVKVADSTGKDDSVSLYKGKLTLPNGDVFNGKLNTDGKYAAGTQYVNGTYTWKSGCSYKGDFMYYDKTPSKTTNGDGVNYVGTASYTTKATYGYFYFDSKKKDYLYIRFIKGKPYGTGTYVENGVKYTVKFDKNGACTYTALAK